MRWDYAVMINAMGGITLADVTAARDRLRGIVRATPMEPSRVLEEVLGGPVYLKCENLQRAGSFKIRGAYHRIARLSEADRARGVVAASAGNHAQGVALAASMLGIKSRVFMPTGAPLPKIVATRGYGAEVELVGNSVAEALEAAQQWSAQHGAVLIHPFDHPDVIAGQGTVGLEILEQRPDVRTIVVAVGGGGLISGLAVAVKASRPDVRIVGVQAAGAASFAPSLAAGEPVALTQCATIADGIAVSRPGDLTFPAVRDLVDEVVAVTDEEIARALVLLLERAKLVVEPAGAAGVAALLAGRISDVAAPVVAVLSGGNIDPLLMHRMMEHGLAASGRYARFSVRFTDRPGELSALLALVAAHGANVVDVRHDRHESRLGLGEVDVALSVETRGVEHAERLFAALAAAGYPITRA